MRMLIKDLAILDVIINLVTSLVVGYYWTGIATLLTVAVTLRLTHNILSILNYILSVGIKL